MKVYDIVFHGSNVDFDSIDLSYGEKSGLEFGRGFYTTPDIATAKSYAILRAVENNEPDAFLIEYSFDYAAIPKDFNIKEFEDYSVEWFKYIVLNLHNLPTEEGVDIVIGPLENQDAWKVVRDYENEFISFEDAINELKNIQIELQIVFKTERAVKLLHKTNVTKIDVEKEVQNAE